MILSGDTIRLWAIVSPHCPRTKHLGASYGESYAGYDIRVAKKVRVFPFFTTLAVSLEHFTLPVNVLGRVHDKSTWARCGLSAFNTVLEPGWHGYLTLELTYKPVLSRWWRFWLTIPSGCPIAQVLFEQVDRDTKGYSGKYQDQPCRPVEARFE